MHEGAMEMMYIQGHFDLRSFPLDALSYRMRAFVKIHNREQRYRAKLAGLKVK